MFGRIFGFLLVLCFGSLLWFFGLVLWFGSLLWLIAFGIDLRGPSGTHSGGYFKVANLRFPFVSLLRFSLWVGSLKSAWYAFGRGYGIASRRSGFKFSCILFHSLITSYAGRSILFSFRISRT